MNQTLSHRDYLMKHFAAPAEASAYLNSVAEDGDIKFLLKAIRDVVEAQGGVGVLAEKTKLSRTTLYKTLSETGNPAVSTLDAILAVYGIRIGFFPVVHEAAGRQDPASPAASAGRAQRPRGRSHNARTRARLRHPARQVAEARLSAASARARSRGFRV